VSQAVEAADAFLSVKAFHNKSKAKAAQKDLKLASDKESTEENGNMSQDVPEFASCAGVAGTKT
jgi:hypothetical protein